MPKYTAIIQRKRKPSCLYFLFRHVNNCYITTRDRNVFLFFMLTLTT